MSSADTEVPERQKILALMLKQPNYKSPHWGFILDIVGTVLIGNKPVSQKQHDWLEFYCYTYRDQIRDAVIYEETADDELYELLDESRDINKIIDECEETWKRMKEEQQ